MAGNSKDPPRIDTSAVRGSPRHENAHQAGVSHTRARWVISVRAMIVLLAMAAAALGVLWMSAAAVSGSSQELGSDKPAKVAIPSGPPGVPLTEAPSGASTVPASPGQGVASPGASAGTGSLAGAPSVPVVVVHIVGAVQNPGIVQLPAGSRVFEAIAAAGGALPEAELQAINLAATTADGQQILVPTHEQWLADPRQPAGQAQGPGPGSPVLGGTMNVNTATAEQLEQLPGVGPVLAQRIVKWRNDHGAFASVEELDAVPGIGAKMLASIRDLVSAA